MGVWGLLIDQCVRALGVVLVLLLGSLLAVKMVMWAVEFRRELRYLNSEINRTSGREQRYWIGCRRRLWLSLLPFRSYEE